MSQNYDVEYRYLIDFGTKLFTSAVIFMAGLFLIFLNLGILLEFTVIASWIFMFPAINEIRKANQKIGSPLLQSFSTIAMIGTILLLVANVLFAYVNFFYFSFLYILGDIFNDPTAFAMRYLSANAVSLIIYYIGWIMFYVAWGKMYEYLKENPHNLPPHFQADINSGTKYLRDSYLCKLLFFLIIPPIIGFVLFVIGILRLSGTLKDLTIPQPQVAPYNSNFNNYPQPYFQNQNNPPQQTYDANNLVNAYNQKFGVPGSIDPPPLSYTPLGYTQVNQNYSPPAQNNVEGHFRDNLPGIQQMSGNPKFCSHCGSPLVPDAQFCPSCGSKIGNGNYQ